MSSFSLFSISVTWLADGQASRVQFILLFLRSMCAFFERSHPNIRTIV